MSHYKQPWNDKWKTVKEIGTFGQGTTYLIENNANKEQAVVKCLKNPNDMQARRRMCVEVDALKLLFAKGASVPRVVEGNVEKADDADAALFFVMEWIDGQTLEDYVLQRGRLSLDESLDITAQVASVVSMGHGEGLGHHDLKPKNIMIRLLENDAKQVVVLDYGLSFNGAFDNKLTRASENIWNEFLSLPETNVDGGRRRDIRVDVAHTCGILYFCLTGRSPQLLRDAEDQPPHRRCNLEECGVEAQSDEYYLIDSLFDRGFRVRVNDRFQSIDELLSAMDMVRRSIDSSDQSIGAIAQRESDVLRRHDRVTQLAQLKPLVPLRYGQLVAAIGASHKSENLHLFSITSREDRGSSIAKAARTCLSLDWISTKSRVWTLAVAPHKLSTCITYGMGIADGNLHVFRSVQAADDGTWEAFETIMSSPFHEETTYLEVVHDFRNWLRRAMQQLRKRIVPSFETDGLQNESVRSLAESK